MHHNSAIIPQAEQAKCAKPVRYPGKLSIPGTDPGIEGGGANWSEANVHEQKILPCPCPFCRGSKNTDSSVFYTEIKTKILNTDFDQKILIVATQLLEWLLYWVQQITVTLQ